LGSTVAVGTDGAIADSSAGSQIGNSSRCSSGTGWKRSAGVTGAATSSA
jgi:hypothetical protein